jgi:hypothetical protein
MTPMGPEEEEQHLLNRGAMYAGCMTMKTRLVTRMKAQR